MVSSRTTESLKTHDQSRDSDGEEFGQSTEVIFSRVAHQDCAFQIYSWSDQNSAEL